MAYTSADAAMAARHVREGEARIARFERAIEAIRQLGRSTAFAESVLGTLRTSLTLMREHQQAIDASLADVRRG